MSLAHESAVELTEVVFARVKFPSNGADCIAKKKQEMLRVLHGEWKIRRFAQCAPDPITSDEVQASPPTAENSRNWKQSIVLKLVHSMAEEERLVLSLFYFEQLGHQEISSILDLPSETVLATLSEAKSRLRQQLEQHPGPASRPDVFVTEGGPGG